MEGLQVIVFFRYLPTRHLPIPTTNYHFVQALRESKSLFMAGWKFVAWKFKRTGKTAKIAMGTLAPSFSD
jgi:hypothetical protein